MWFVNIAGSGEIELSHFAAITELSCWLQRKRGANTNEAQHIYPLLMKRKTFYGAVPIYSM